MSDLGNDPDGDCDGYDGGFTEPEQLLRQLQDAAANQIESVKITKSECHCTVAIATVAAALKEHFCEWFSGFCYCGIPIETYNQWIEHITTLLHMEGSHDGDVQPDTEPV